MDDSPQARYPGTYTDAHGSEPIVFENDGRTLCTRIRGVEFSGGDFDMLTPAGDAPAGVTLAHGDLCGCTLRLIIPVPLVAQGTEQAAALEVCIELGMPRPRPRGGIDREALHLALLFSGQRVAADGEHGFFEEALLALQKQLPADTYIKSCFNCLYSDYSVYGNGCFGGMICFRTAKQEYLRVKNKREYMAMKGTPAGAVQETYLCPEFERRIPGTGYRG